MLLDIIDKYTSDTKQTLRDLRKSMILQLNKEHDAKKIVSFLSKCAVIGVEEKDQTVYVGIPNDFIGQQVRKFFKKPLTKAVQEEFNPQYKLGFTTYHDLQAGGHDLQIDLKKLLNIEEKASPQQSLDESTKKKMSNYFGILFEKRFRFDNFVVGANSQLAYSAAEAVATQPGEAYNPLFIYGSVGLGKTHLMQAIGNTIINSEPDYTVVYLPTTKFIDHIIHSIRNNKLNNLLQKLDEVDVLMLDDIQFLAGKEKTQEIFHNIFNDFQSKNKQIVVTSDQSPKSLTLLESRLQSRFTMGLVVDIKPPDTETRIAIMETKLKAKGEQLDPDYLDIIATNVSSNVRELEGALNIILTKKQLLDNDLDKNDIIDSLETLGYTATRPSTSDDQQTTGSAADTTSVSTVMSQKSQFDEIVTAISRYHNVDAKEVRGSNRTKAVSQARQMAMYVAKTEFDWTLERIGSYFGGKNHASVIYAIKKFKSSLQDNDQLKEQLTKIKK